MLPSGNGGDAAPGGAGPGTGWRGGASGRRLAAWTRALNGGLQRRERDGPARSTSPASHYDTVTDIGIDPTPPRPRTGPPGVHFPRAHLRPRPLLRSSLQL